jgi:glycosyltransferase involved in cell wall biosynthesis
MRILFVADGRSPIALQWIAHFANSGHEVHLSSTFPCQPALKLVSLHTVPVAFSGSSGAGTGRSLLPVGIRTGLRNWLGPLTINSAAAKLKTLIDEIKPNLVHAMRVPYEGMLAAAANPAAPLLISTWGNDFTLHANSNPFMASATRRTMHRADALHSDTQRDVRLAKEWGLGTNKPTIVMPGNGGVRRDIFYPPKTQPTQPRVINPRGIRSYVRNDVFFRSIPLVLREMPDVVFDCPVMKDEPEAEGWVGKLGIEKSVNLLPKLTPSELADVYRAAQVMVSHSIHDGTPNSLLEAMACRVLPVLGDLDSIREWITDGENGLLVDPADPKALAAAIVKALKDPGLRERAAKQNAQLILELANYKKNMNEAENFYKKLVV